MKIEHLEEHVNDYRTSIKTVVDKRLLWKTKTKGLLIKTLKTIVKLYDIGWKVQELSWIHNNEAINITFDSFPNELIDCTNLIPAYQFLPGGALIFSQSYNGDIYIFMLFPEIENLPKENNVVELGTYTPETISEKLIIEKVDEFLKEMIRWEVPSVKSKVGY
ncbi:hypothetical protein J8L88_18945 [Aquimarina sp. MMG015]|uniref:hypothetical protein n=1 Tax=Aquimarina TaxID=290174 RepID=UPI000417C9A2|nr:MULTISPECIES: hypothetical protein [Aquimarina]AXT58225.1 hypothetical protein D1815_21560 [Aquimarina sp. AD1]MBQ4804950.1 hypothetical protein [Aquimarina sp. MMG015]RKN16951.1 hypothetical protein D7035_15050 [Aquimarina sp. AD1]